MKAKLILLAALVALPTFTGCSTLMQSQYERDAAYLRDNYPSLSEQQIQGIIASVHGDSAQPSAVAVPSNGTPVIHESDCIGAVVNGVCHGTPSPGAPSNAAFPDRGFGTTVIRESDCIGAVVNGVCHGTPTPEAEIKIRTGQAPRCYGTMIGGMCTGPMF